MLGFIPRSIRGCLLEDVFNLRIRRRGGGYTIEAIAKLEHPEKSMILSRFASFAIASMVYGVGKAIMKKDGQ